MRIDGPVVLLYCIIIPSYIATIGHQLVFVMMFINRNPGMAPYVVPPKKRGVHMYLAAPLLEIV